MKRMLTLSLLIACAAAAEIRQSMPKGLMMTLDFESVQDGLIPSKALFPLYVPMGELDLEWFQGRNLLAFREEQSLSIPHSSLLEPNGDEWIMTIRAFPLTDGVIASQHNDEHGFIVYVLDGQIMLWVKTANTAFPVMENPYSGISKFKKKWVTIEIRIRDDMTILYLNRKRAAMVARQPGLNGADMRIRLGHHTSKPPPFANVEGIPTRGFTGAINSFKITRQ